MSCGIGEATERSENERRKGLEDEALLILQPFRRFTYVTAHSPTLPFLHLCHLASRLWVGLELGITYLCETLLKDVSSADLNIMSVSLLKYGSVPTTTMGST